MLNPALLTPKASTVLILNCQHQAMDDIHSPDFKLIQLNGRVLARLTRAFRAPVILSTIGVQMYPLLRALSHD